MPPQMENLLFLIRLAWIPKKGSVKNPTHIPSSHMISRLMIWKRCQMNHQHHHPPEEVKI
ncbi:conserved hypothetical protein [Ricinus communis]|uniref:Uncharacterized protein n=1 Tax=Ricinus communis TaxID=3988 RepID=B9T731_RICCO|nr:conserved hypothetical protein [Ricinus communis]